LSPREILRHYGGYLEIKSRKGKSTAAILHLAADKKGGKMNGKGDILIVDDEPNARKVLSAILEEEGYGVLQSGNVEGATELIGKQYVDAVITDMKMPGKDGVYLFDHITKTRPDIPVIFLTAYGTVESAVSVITRGAFHYFVKPPDYPSLKSVLARAVKQRGANRDDRSSEGGSWGEYQSHIIGNTPEMRRLFETVGAVKTSQSNVLVCGETGTGKELIAKALIGDGKAKDRPFVAVNCAAIPKELIEVELFGCEKGAFTGAVSRRTGKFEEAANGVVFLDEISELELSMQAKLLRVLQEREIERIGSNKKIKVEFRLISATNRDLAEEVKKGRFREDLYYRINVVEINVPPLRERTDDIPLLAAAFLEECCKREKKKINLSHEVSRAFQAYHWPGNVRQLRNIIERAVVLSKNGNLTLADLPAEFGLCGESPKTVSNGKTLKEVELKAIRAALQACKGNKSKTAKVLKISRKALYKRLRDGVDFT
jgi:DNA-binding NtrC family response regulator